MISVRQTDDGRISVEFTAPSCIRAGKVALVGDFNDWCRDTNPMTQCANGEWSVSIELSPGRHRFRYVADDDRWLNDWSADDYVANAFGGEDSVVHVPAAGATDSSVTG